MALKLSQRQRTNRALKAIGTLISTANDGAEAIAHEVAHGILLFGGVDADLLSITRSRIEHMSASAANRHEVRTIALQHAAMQALGAPQALRAICGTSFSSLEQGRTLVSITALMRAASTCQVSPRTLNRFVEVVTTFERCLLRK